MSMEFSREIIYYLALAAAIGLTMYFLVESSKKPKEPETETRELLECPRCGYRIEKPFEPGDFIGMIKDKCPKCGAPMKIKAIYDIVKKPAGKT